VLQPVKHRAFRVELGHCDAPQNETFLQSKKGQKTGQASPGHGHFFHFWERPYVDALNDRLIEHRKTLDNLTVSVCDSNGVIWALQSGPNALSCQVNNATSLVRVTDGTVVLSGLPSNCTFESFRYLIARGNSDGIVYVMLNLSGR
jgi:hypothetical protein